MAMSDSVETGRSSVYDDDGRTRIPDDVRETLGWEKGDKLKFVAIDGELRVLKSDE